MSEHLSERSSNERKSLKIGISAWSERLFSLSNSTVKNVRVRFVLDKIAPLTFAFFFGFFLMITTTIRRRRN